MTTDEQEQLAELIESGNTNSDQIIGLLHDVVAELREANETLDALYIRTLPWWIRWGIRHHARHHQITDEESLRAILEAAHRADEEDRPNPMQDVLWIEPGE